MSLKKHLPTVLTTLLSIIIVTGCTVRRSGSYVVRSAKRAPLSTNALIGIYVQPGFASPHFSGYLASSLIAGGFRVKEIRPEKIVPPSLQHLVLTGERETLFSEIVNHIGEGGKFTMSESVFAKVYADNALKQGQEMIQDWARLIQLFSDTFKLTHLLSVYPSPNPYCWYVELIELASREITFTYYINANAIGFYQKISRPDTHEGLTISRPDKRDRSADEIVFCEHIVNLLKN